MKQLFNFLAAAMLLPVINTSAQCEASALPYLENFENAAVPALPDCTSSLTLSPQANNWQTAVVTQSGQSSTVLQYNMSSEAEALEPVVFSGRPVLMETGTDYKISFSYTTTGNASVFYVSAQLKNTVTGNIAQVTYMPSVQQGISGLFVSTLINVPQNGSYVLEIEMRANSAVGFFNIDNILIEKWICPIPENLQVTAITPTTASFSWDGETPGWYQYSVVPQGEEPVFATASGITTATKTGLNPNTAYAVHIRKRCQNQSGQYYWSAWSEAVGFSTGVLGLNNWDKNEFEAYPNPVKDILTIATETIIDNITINSLTGQQVISLSPHSNQVLIDLQDLSEGIYLLSVSSEGKSVKKKLIKN